MSKLKFAIRNKKVENDGLAMRKTQNKGRALVFAVTLGPHGSAHFRHGIGRGVQTKAVTILFRGKAVVEDQVQILWINPHT